MENTNRIPVATYFRERIQSLEGEGYKSNFTREYTENLMSEFKRLAYTKADGTLEEIVLVYGAPERAVGKGKEKNTLVLPVASLTVKSITDGDQRQKYEPLVNFETHFDQKTQKAKRIVSLTPKAVVLNYTFGIYAKFLEDINQLTEKIELLFGPSLKVPVTFDQKAQAFITDRQEAITTSLGDKQDRVLKRLITISIETYIPPEKFLITNTGVIERFNADLVIEGSPLVAPVSTSFNPYEATFSFTTSPKEGQLFPKDDTGYSTLSYTGKVETVGWDTITLEIYRFFQGNTTLYQEVTQGLAFDNSEAFFNLQVTFPRGPFLYSTKVILKNNKENSLKISEVNNLYSGDAFLIAGQSNARARNWDDPPIANTYMSKWVRSYGSTSYDKTTFLSCDTWGDGEGEAIESDYGIGQWALRLGNYISENLLLPVAFINGAVGGREIKELMANESNHEDINTWYGRALIRAKKSELVNHIKTIFWFQGEAENEFTDDYQSDFATLLTSWEEDYPALESVYVLQTRKGCGVPDGSMLMELQRQLQERHSKVTLVSTTNLQGYLGCHYSFQGYEEIASRLYNLLLRDIYNDPSLGSTVDSANVLSASYTSTAKDEIKVTFEPLDIDLYADTDAELDFYLEDGVKVESIAVNGNEVFLTLKASSTSTRLRYERDSSDRKLLAGSWITNTNGVGVLTFDIDIT